jgi:serine/threonine protein phosphatase PrpC
MRTGFQLGVAALGESKVVVVSAGRAILGQRSEQQDSFHLRSIGNKRGLLLVVADGMGGHKEGAMASRIAADGFVAEFLVVEEELDLSSRLEGALLQANDRILRFRQAQQEPSDMGTTLSAALISAGSLSWVSVGDSPIWLFSAGTLKRLSDDHSLRAVVGPNGRGANMLQSALTGDPIPMVDLQLDHTELADGDLVIVASDGLMTLPDDEIQAILRENGGTSPSDLVDVLLRSVEERRLPSQDNCTVLIGAISISHPSWIRRVLDSFDAVSK